MKNILVAADYVSKWVEAIELANNEVKSVTAFLKKKIFSRFGTPRAIISDGGSNFARSFSKGYWINMGFATMCPLHIILSLVGKLMCQTEKLCRF